MNINSIADSSKYGVVPGNSDVLWINLKGIGLDGTGDGNYSPLVKAATQFLRLNLPSKAYRGYETGSKLDVEVAVKMIVALGSNLIHAFSSFDNEARTNGWCVSIDTSKTLVRLNNPVYKKYGGGLRVKFIKIYDNFKRMTDSSKESVYGQVYDYTTIKNINGKDTRISSGIASWEPMLGGEENPFRIPLEYIEKVAPLAPVTNGYTELPLGETFFPAPSVGYSQVRITSIHTTNIKSAIGYEETKFYTSYDFPVITDNSLFTPDTKKRYKTSLSEFLRIRSEHYLTMSQGFKIELNDMNGKIKSQASYSQTDSIHPIASSTYYYHVDDQNAEFKHLNNTVKVVDQTGKIDTTATIGKDIELMMDMREQHSLSEGVDYGVNVDVFVIFLFPVPLPSYIPMPQKEETRFRSVATTKVIQRFGILDSVVAIDKGSKISTDNLLYDSETGDVLLTRTKNEFNDTLYNFTYPAHWAYGGMGQAYQNIDAVYNSDESNNIQIINGTLRSTSKYPGMLSWFESGDEILALGKLKIGEDTSHDCNGQTGCPTPVFSDNSDITKIWAVKSKKVDSSNTSGVVFIDRNGNPYSGDSVSLKIIRSGHKNISATAIGSVAMLRSPIRTINNKPQIIIDSSKNILFSSAFTYKDVWKTTNFQKASIATYTLTLQAGLCNGNWSFKDGSGNINNAALDRSGDCSGIWSFDIKAIPGSISVSAGMSFQLSADQTKSSYFSPIIDTILNPYVYGIFGNWRQQKSYVYYGSRKESVTSNVTNIRSNGIIQNYTPYWSFSNNYLIATLDTTAYVWNSTSTQFNHKGFEIENKDPLGRYNAGAYGYNESLPINVVQNSKYKDQFFDGFEDYRYSTQSCNKNCPVPRLIDFETGGGIIDSVSHSGKYGLRINANDSSTLTFKVNSVDTLSNLKLRIKTDTSYSSGYIAPNYHNKQDIDKINDRYQTYILAPQTGLYNFNFDIAPPDNCPGTIFYKFSIDNITDSNDDYTYVALNNISLVAGQIYTMTLRPANCWQPFRRPTFSWTTPCTLNYAIKNYLYNSASVSDTADNIHTNTTLCSAIQGIHTDSSSLLPVFSLTQGNRMVFSAWVKEQKDCLCQSYDSDRVNFTFARANHADTVLSFKPKGNLIEGWQRYDTVITVPLDATSMRLA